MNTTLPSPVTLDLGDSLLSFTLPHLRRIRSDGRRVLIWVLAPSGTACEVYEVLDTDVDRLDQKFAASTGQDVSVASSLMPSFHRGLWAGLSDGTPVKAFRVDEAVASTLT